MRLEIDERHDAKEVEEADRARNRRPADGDREHDSDTRWLPADRRDQEPAAVLACSFGSSCTCIDDAESATGTSPADSCEIGAPDGARQRSTAAHMRYGNAPNLTAFRTEHNRPGRWSSPNCQSTNGVPERFPEHSLLPTSSERDRRTALTSGLLVWTLHSQQQILDFPFLPPVEGTKPCEAAARTVCLGNIGLV